MKLFTIGFTQTSAENFFSRIADSGARTLIDVRLNNVSQLSGFAKRDDLRFFMKTICGIEYFHEPRLAPTQAMLDSYNKVGGGWGRYEQQFLSLIEERKIETYDREMFDGACLLCSERKPHYCHRSLVAKYLHRQWGGIQIVDL